MKGGYAIIIKIETNIDLSIRRHEFSLAEGTYIYSGFALGPGGIEARIGRHIRTLRKTMVNDDATIGKAHWHIDWLLPLSGSYAIVYAESGTRTECLLVDALKKIGFEAVKGFGSTDCRSACGGHLLYAGDCGVHAASIIAKKAFKAVGLKPVAWPSGASEIK